jgi:predicted deacetylase
MVLAGVLAMIYFTFFYYANLLYTPPVLFNEDDNISIALYPKNHQAAFVLSNDDVSAITPLNKLKTLVSFLKKNKAKSTFFVVPEYKGKFSLLENKPLIHCLKSMQNDGFEIAQHGLTHFMPRHNTRINKSQEFRGMIFSEQKRRILRGKNILETAGLKISGFRSPAFSSNTDTFKILDESGFLYSSDVRIKPFLLMTNRKYAESIYYPFHINGFNFVEFVVNGDYFGPYPDTLGETTGDYANLKRRFNQYYKSNGAFILLTHLNKVSDITKPKNLKLLKRFLDYTKSKNIWYPTLNELAVWWKARESLFAESFIEKNTLNIILENNSEQELKNLAVIIKPEIKEAGVNKYKIYIETADIESKKRKLIQSGNFSNLKNNTFLIDI